MLVVILPHGVRHSQERIVGSLLSERPLPDSIGSPGVEASLNRGGHLHLEASEEGRVVSKLGLQERFAKVGYILEIEQRK